MRIDLGIRPDKGVDFIESICERGNSIWADGPTAVYVGKQISAGLLHTLDFVRGSIKMKKMVGRAKGRPRRTSRNLRKQSSRPSSILAEGCLDAGDIRGKHYTSRLQTPSSHLSSFRALTAMIQFIIGAPRLGSTIGKSVSKCLDRH
jgi:hypothetical protein